MTWLSCCLLTLSSSALSLAVKQDPVAAQGSIYFGIQVVDQETGRGVPLVTLTTVNHLTYVTDSAGWIAFHEPGLMDRDVFFHVSSHGYQFPKDGFGYRGLRLRTTPGQVKQISIKATNIARRMYRVTGAGIYRDSTLLGVDFPIERPNLNGGVLGQDTVQTAVYRDRVHWFWGDTNRTGYPLGQFKTSGATSLLPTDGGLDPSRGINLEYFVDGQGFSRQMAPIQGPGAVWLHGLFVLNQPADGAGDSELLPARMIGHYARVKSLGHRYEHGLVIYDDADQVFDKLVEFQDSDDLYPRGQALYGEPGTGEFIYFATPFPYLRVRATLEAVRDPAQYEAYTCLRPGTRYTANTTQIEFDAQGRAVWDWKRNTSPVDATRQQALIRFGLLSRQDAKVTFVDEQRAPLQGGPQMHAGSVHWNSYRNKWILIGVEAGGSNSYLGEVWYAEAASLEGPWQGARKIVTHDHYTFYNPAHHPFLDQQNGRIIYFEGTYADTFSRAQSPTPRYNYNQVMYQLDLADPDLGLQGSTPPRTSR